LHYPFVDVAVLSSENTSDKKSIVHTLSLKEGFCGVYIRKRGEVFWGQQKERNTVPMETAVNALQTSYKIYDFIFSCGKVICSLE